MRSAPRQHHYPPHPAHSLPQRRSTRSDAYRAGHSAATRGGSSAPERAITAFLVGAPDGLDSLLSAQATSMPDVTSPKIVYDPSRCGAGAITMLRAAGGCHVKRRGARAAGAAARRRAAAA